MARLSRRPSPASSPMYRSFQPLRLSRRHRRHGKRWKHARRPPLTRRRLMPPAQRTAVTKARSALSTRRGPVPGKRMPCPARPCIPPTASPATQDRRTNARPHRRPTPPLRKRKRRHRRRARPPSLRSAPTARQARSQNPPHRRLPPARPASCFPEKRSLRQALVAPACHRHSPVNPSPVRTPRPPEPARPGQHKRQPPWQLRPPWRRLPCRAQALRRLR